MQVVMLTVGLLLGWPDKPLEPAQEAYRSAAAAAVREAFLSMPDVLEFEVELSGAELTPTSLPPITVPQCSGESFVGSHSVSGQFSYVLKVRHEKAGDEFLYLRDSSGKDRWSYETKGETAIEKAAGEPTVEHRIVPGSRTNPLAYADRFSSCSVRTYLINFVESPDETVFPLSFWERIRKARLVDGNDPRSDTWLEMRFLEGADGLPWERTDALIVDRETHLPKAWYSRDIDRDSDGNVVRIQCKSRRYEWKLGTSGDSLAPRPKDGR